MKATESILDLIEKSESGPVLFLNGDNEPITLGSFHALNMETRDTLHGALWLFRQLEERFRAADSGESGALVMVRLALGHVIQIQEELMASADMNKREFWADPENDRKITFTPPTWARPKAKGKKGGAE